MVLFSTTGLLLHVALFRLGTTHDCAIGQAGPSIWSRLLPAILPEVPMRRIGLTLMLSIALSPLAEAQPQGKLPLVGVLEPGRLQPPPRCFGGFQQSLRDLGYVEGRTIRLAYRYAED